MKRTAIILLSAVYLLSSLGIAAESHYCCGILQSTTLFHDTKLDCKMASQMKHCCKTKKQYFKVKDQHFGVSNFTLNTKLFSAIQIPYLAAQTVKDIPVKDIFYFNNHAPPNRDATHSYILNCTYRI
ncbi:MAG TPA: hypothetical protein VIJ27_07415 [Mucilaginibacter sp.]